MFKLAKLELSISVSLQKSTISYNVICNFYRFCSWRGRIARDGT